MADIKKLEKELWEAADNLHANSKLTSQQYCMPVLGLIFLRYAWGRFKTVDAQIKESRAMPPTDRCPSGLPTTRSTARCPFPKRHAIVSFPS